MILEQQTIPLALRRIHNTALGHAAAIGSDAGIQHSLALIGT